MRCKNCTEGLVLKVTEAEIPEDLPEDIKQIATEQGFLGSGTTLIACEWTGRVCRTMDNDPKYAAVVLERWSQMTKENPILEG